MSAPARLICWIRVLLPSRRRWYRSRSAPFLVVGHIYEAVMPSFWCISFSSICMSLCIFRSVGGKGSSQQQTSSGLTMVSAMRLRAVAARRRGSSPRRGPSSGPSCPPCGRAPLYLLLDGGTRAASSASARRLLLEHTLRWGKRALFWNTVVHRTLQWRCLRDVPFRQWLSPSEAGPKACQRRTSAVFFRQPDGPSIVAKLRLLRTDKFTLIQHLLYPPKKFRYVLHT